jgi:hypothetical protein
MLGAVRVDNDDRAVVGGLVDQRVLAKHVLVGLGAAAVVQKKGHYRFV